MVQKSARIGRPLSFHPGEALTKAQEAFWRSGYGPTSLPDLEVATGLARSSIYNHFGDKRDFFLAALAAYAEAVGDELTRPLEQGTAGLDDLNGFFDLIERHARDRQAPCGCLVVNSLVEVGDSDPDVDRIVSGYVNRLRAGFAAALRRAAERGETSAEAISSRADLLVTLAIGISASCRAGDSHSLPLLAAARAQVEEWRT